MPTMKAAVCKARETIAIEDVPRPTPKRGEVLVAVKATGLCGSDVDGYTGHHPMIKWPIILGHECSGVVAEVGPGETRWKPGDPVVVEPFFTCKTCPACLRGQYNLCVDLKITGHQVPGSLAEFVIAESFFLHPKPANLSFAEAAIAEPVSGSLHGVERANPRLGSFVTILGCGTIGVLAMQHCLNKGAEVLIADPAAFKRKVAKDLGVHHALDPLKEDVKARVKELTGGIGADVVIEAVGKPETLAATVGLVRRGGTILLIGWSGNKTDAFDLTSVTLDELTVLGTLGFCWDHKAALRLLSQGKVTVKPIISHRLPLDRVEDGIRMLQSHAEGVWKIAITEEEV
ncbi:MAG TPA: alcohol dehydrogenase catalytic domain-containing protein [Planctomycetota bacterium]|nr:alcohol dehydrogenase catalytic domain-containing protein [Planctomycetota bacterium]HRR79332.1 alcohol dehydrogenase catalytic domain-containing protein [Planctomycetota bacterium]HRT96754.1 alcohol dehydrogenase catalytic domain-containing protein [Planctomycetota bacterium]